MRYRPAGAAALAALVGTGAMTGFGSGADAVRQDVIGGGAQGAPAGAVAIAFPSLGAEVAGPGEPVQRSAPDAIGIGGDLHVDLIVNGGVERLERVGNHVVVPQSPPGEHQIELVVEDNNDKSVDGIAGATVNFTVLAPLPVRMHAGNCDSSQPDPVALPLGSDPFNPVEVSETRLELPVGSSSASRTRWWFTPQARTWTRSPAPTRLLPAARLAVRRSAATCRWP